MSVSSASGAMLLNRILTLREASPFLLCLDTVLQSSHHLTNELIHKVTSTKQQVEVVYVSFETAFKPQYATTFIEALNISASELQTQLSRQLAHNKRTLIIVDSFNYLRGSDLNRILAVIASPANTVYGTYHLDIPSSSDRPGMPTDLSILRFIATTVFEVRPKGEVDKDAVTWLELPVGVCNKKTFEMTLIFRRKSGRAMEYQLSVDTTTHNYSEVTAKKDVKKDQNEVLKGLTTFNLSTTRRQKLERDKVELPFLEAQSNIGSVAGSTVYEFDRDDDYDEGEETVMAGEEDEP